MSELVWIVGVFGGSCVLLSLAIHAAVRLAPLDRLHPRPRARVLTVAAVLPALGGLVVALAVFVPHPWLGLPDHCLIDGGHLHLCLRCGMPAPPLGLTAFALLFCLRAAWRVAPELLRGVRAGRLVRRLGGGERVGDVIVLPLDAPLAFTAGFLRPRIFVSRSTAARPEWRAVMAHERDHAIHRDPLIRLVVRVGAALHAPLVGALLDRRLVAAQELAADEAAADDLGDRLEVARQIVAWARAAQGTPATDGLAARFDEGDLDHRVRVLLDAPAYLTGPTRAHVAGLSLVTAALTGALTTSIHHGVEVSLHLLGA
ncbi:MAG: M48 family metalloprotease [Myxococcota bacterium]|nr:M48 family metalloprotease [Myxococcota bacterium]